MKAVRRHTPTVRAHFKKALMIKFPQITILFIFINCSLNEIKGQLFIDIDSNNPYSTNFDSIVVSKTLNKFTYAFCQIGDQGEFESAFHAKNYYKLYKIVGVYTTADTTYSQKVLISRTLVFNGIPYYDSIPIYSITYEKIDKDLAWSFFVSLNGYRFHKIDISCLTNRTFPIDNGLSQMIDITDYSNEEILMHANGKTRKIIAYAPETFLCEYPEQLSKYPELNLCRAIYVICRNMFENMIWNKNEP
jgi:hypothetical protein